MSGLLPDWMIKRDIKIVPFEPQQNRPGVISYGATSYGYDVRVDNKLLLFDRFLGAFVDTKNFNPKIAEKVVVEDGKALYLPAHGFALAETVEWIEIPRDILAICVGKSTYARCGIIINVTPLEPEWRGKVTLEIHNTTELTAKIYAGEGIAQMLFFRAEAECKTSYADKKGKYQDQAGLTLPIVK